MAEDESTVAGGGRLLGTNNLQRAVDGIEKTVTRLASVLGTLAPAVQGMQRGQAAAGSWNKLSNWTGTNGGGATFNGQPGSTTPNGGGPKFPNTGTVPNGGAPAPTSHRAPGPATWTGGGGGGAHAGPGNGLYYAGATVGFGIDMAKQINENVGQTPADASTDSRTYLTYGRMMSDGQNVNIRSMFNRNQATGLSGTDVAAAAMGAWQNSGYAAGTAGFNRYRNMVGAQNLLNPTMSAAQATATTAQFGTARGYNMMRMVGIQTLTNRGTQKTPTMIANEVLKQVDPEGNVSTPEQIRALLGSQTSPLNQTLTNWVSNGVISPDQVDMIKSSIEAILKARQHGVGARALDTLLNQRESTNKSVANKAAATLKTLHVADTQAQADKDVAGSQREGTVSRLDGFEKGLTASTQGLKRFHDLLNKFTPQWLNNLTGASRGVRDGGIPGIIGFGLGLVGLGGDNEDRMSVLALRGRESGTISGAGGGSSSSGSPHNAGAAAMGGMSVGGPANSTGRSGGTAKSKAGSSGQKMILPARGPLGAYFGQRGSHWSSGHHTGQDIICPAGTPVHAPANGTVIFAGWDGPYGRLVRIDHGGGVVSYLAHNSRLVAHVGAAVRQGQLVAYSGATGNVTGAHCHFEVRVNGRSVNPMRYVSGSGRVSGGGGGGGTSGSGTNSPNGSGTATTDSGSGGGGLAGSSIGMSELDVLAGALSGGGGSFGGGDSSGTGDSGSPGGGGSIGGSGSISTGGGSGAGAVYRALRSAGFSKVIAAGIMGNMQPESGFDPNIVQGGGHSSRPNTQVGYGLVQWTPGTKLKGYIGNHPATIANEIAALRDQLQGRGPSPEGAAGRALKSARTPEEAARIFGLQYERYAGGVQGGRESAARRYFHGYASGAWDLKSDEDARVHKGEMIIPKPQAQQIREVLLNNNPYGARTKGGGEGVVLKFEEGSIKISLGDSATRSQGAALGKSIVDAIAADSRIKALQNGFSHV